MLLSQLGLQADRAVIPHVDDLGASHGANAAFLDLARRHRVTCGSVMVPGPWFPEIAEAARADPSLDLGVHLTLTSEWQTCRWSPISTTSRTSGLIDDDGYCWRDVESLHHNLVPEAAELELRTQIDRAIAAGLRPTHIDAHMAAAMLPALLDLHIRLAREYALFPVLPRSVTWAPNPAYAETLAAIEATGAPIIDHCRGTLPVPRATLPAAWAAQIARLDRGVTHLALHCTTPSDFTAMSPSHTEWRTAEYEWLSDGGLDESLSQSGVARTGTRAIQALWMKSGQADLPHWYAHGLAGGAREV